MEVTRIINDIPAQTYDSDWITANQNKLVNGELVSNWVIASKYEGDFVNPKWDGANYYESAIAEEIEKPKLQKIGTLEKIVYDKIKRYSLALAMGKKVDDDLGYFEAAYTNKYNLSKLLQAYILDNTLPNPDPLNTLSVESQLEGYDSLEAYLNDVVLKFEQGKGFRDIALQMSEVMRKLIMNDKAIKNYDKVIARLTIVDDLEDTIQASEVGGIFNQIINL